MKNNTSLYFTLIFFVVSNFFSQLSFSEDKINFLSLKNNKVNLRQGPSFEYPIILVYKKKNLPVVVIDASETWRKIKDFYNNSGWIHVSQLSKKKSGVNIKNESIVYKKPTIYSKPIVKLELGRLVLIRKCKEKWCKIKTGDFTGWILKKYLWGKT